MGNHFEKLAMQYHFEREIAGGGCIALTRYFPDDIHVMITGDGGGHMPEGDIDETGWMIGVYDKTFEEIGEPVKLFQGKGIGNYLAAMISAINEAESIMPSTDDLADELQAWCTDKGLPQMSADELLLEVLDWREYLEKFISRWESVQAVEDFNSAIAARGESRP